MRKDYLLILALGFTFLLAALEMITIDAVLKAYPWGILIILISLDIFTKLIIQTRIIEVLAVRLGVLCRGYTQLVIIAFSILLFFISSIINNITAVMIVLPVLFVLMESMSISRRCSMAFLSLLLVISNLGGAATPIGDFPAIVIMKSGLTSFSDYLIRAFPLCLISAVIVLFFHLILNRLYISDRKKMNLEEQQEIGVYFLKLQYINYRIEKRLFLKLLIIFIFMFISWSILPPEQFPPEIIAIAGLAMAVVITGEAGRKVLDEPFHLTSSLTLGSYLALATLAQVSGLLNIITNLILILKNHPPFLLITMMLGTGILTGIFSAGPTAAAMMPIVMQVANTIFLGKEDWIAIAFAVSVCAGSSLFLNSASAGPIFSEKVKEARLNDAEGNIINWGWLNYLPYGLLHFILQISVAIIWVFSAMYLL